MKIDYSRAAGGGQVVPGEYEVVVDGYEVTTSQNGNQCVQLSYRIREDVDQGCQGLRIYYDTFTFTENAFWRVCAAAKAAGIPDGFDIPDEMPERFGEIMKGRYLRLVVQERTYNNKTYPSVKEFWATTTAAKQPTLPRLDKDGFQPAGENDFMNIPDGIEDGLPFN